MKVIPNLSPEWIVSFTLRITSLAPSTIFCNIIQLSKEGPELEFGDRTPAVFLFPSRDQFYISSSINSNRDTGFSVTKGIALNVPTHIEIHQRYISGGKYRYFVKINGEEVASIINTNALQFYNVRVYASKGTDPCPGYIKNLEVTNFL